MYRNILVPIAFDHERDTADALKVARTLAEKGTRVTFLHVMEEASPFALSYMPQGYMEELRIAIQAELNEMANSFENGVGVLLEGHSSRTILQWAKENEVDCIVIASHRPGMQDYLLGSTAAHVVRHAHCAVHVLR